MPFDVAKISINAMQNTFKLPCPTSNPRIMKIAHVPRAKIALNPELMYFIMLD